MSIENLLGPILIILVALAQTVLIAWKIIEKRAEKKMAEPPTQTKTECKPGHARVCQENKTDITELKVINRFVSKEITEINSSIGSIFSELRKINGN